MKMPPMRVSTQEQTPHLVSTFTSFYPSLQFLAHSLSYSQSVSLCLALHKAKDVNSISRCVGKVQYTSPVSSYSGFHWIFDMCTW